MSTPQPEHNHPQPAGNQPWGQKAVRIHGYRGAMKTLLSHLPTVENQEQSPDHGIHGVLEVGINWVGNMEKVFSRLSQRKRAIGTPSFLNSGNNSMAYRQ
jgi:hypothetical protein